VDNFDVQRASLLDRYFAAALVSRRCSLWARPCAYYLVTRLGETVRRPNIRPLLSLTAD